MGLTFNNGRNADAITSDSSLNVGIGGAPSGSYKFEVTGTGSFSGALTVKLAKISRGLSDDVDSLSIGEVALANSTTAAIASTAYGRQALRFNTSGAYNTAFGSQAIMTNTTGGQNTAIGTFALGTANTSYNVAVGYSALMSASSGSNNTSIGWNAGSSITTGSNNTIVGAYAGSATLASNVILADGAGNVRFQWDGSTTRLPAYVSIGNTNSTYNLDVTGTGRFTGALTALQGVFKNSGVPAIQAFRDLDVTVVGTAGQGIELGARNGASTYVAGAAIYGTLDNPATTGSLIFQTLTAGSLTTKLTLASTGAATFSSSVTSNSGADTYFQLARANGDYAFQIFRNFSLGVDILRTKLSDNTTWHNYITIGEGNASHAASNLIINEQGGNVGIGTTSPDQLLVINGGNLVVQQSSAADSRILLNPQSTINYISSTYNTTGSFLPLGFKTSDTERMRITSGGNVLVGTTTDSGEKLQVNGSIRASGAVHSNNALSADYGASNSIGLGSFIALTNPSNSYQTIFQLNASYGIDIYNYQGTWNKIANINQSTGIYTPLSDSSKKKDFEPSTIGLNEVLQLKPTLYRMKTEDENASKTLGFIAQEVQPFIPQAYVENDGFIGLNDRPIIAATIKAIQEIVVKYDNKIQELEAKIEELKNK